MRRLVRAARRIPGGVLAPYLFVVLAWAIAMLAALRLAPTPAARHQQSTFAVYECPPAEGVLVRRLELPTVGDPPSDPACRPPGGDDSILDATPAAPTPSLVSP